MYGYQDFRDIPSTYIMGMPQQYYPMIYMPTNQLEMMYPEVYHIMNNAVKHHCDMMEMKSGPMYMPGKDELDSMVENVYKDTGSKVEEMEDYKGKSKDERQFGSGGRRLFQDFIRILLIRELLRRRREHGYEYGHGYGGFEYY